MQSFHLLSRGLLSLSLIGATPALAQRASENAVKAAEDAFGVSVGSETLGLYDPDNVRGFSALDAGNARLDGLYFDPVWRPSPRLQSTTTIRVGIAAQGFAFPAPTGVVDYTMRHPGDTFKASGFVSVDSYDFLAAESDVELPLIKGKLSLGAGIAGYRESYYNGTTDFNRAETLILRWRPTASLELLPFWSHGNIYASQAPPLYLPAGDYLPPPIERRRFEGPLWAENRSERYNYGIIGRWSPAPGWRVDAGMFRSGRVDPVAFTNLLTDLNPAGRADQIVIVDPRAYNRSSSGELRVSRDMTAGAWHHAIMLTLRGRDRERTYGGSDVIDLGTIALGQRQTAPRPVFAFSAQTRDHIRQGTIGLAYQGSLRDIVELSASVQKTAYRKDIRLPDAGAASTRADPWLYSAASAIHLSKRLDLYASYTRGLEDSGAAPSSAANRNEPLPAIRTAQADAGLRLALSSKLHFVAGLFVLKKPYFEFDAANRFTLLGTLENRGAEFSLSGAVTPNLDIVAGAVLSDPRVEGTAVKPGLVGTEPVDKPRTRLALNLDWRLPRIAGVSFDAGMTYLGRRAATTDDRVHIPARAQIDLGSRYGFKIGEHPAQLRLAIMNVGNVYSYDLSGASAYDIIPGRVAQFSLGVDW